MSISNRLRYEILARDGFRCKTCGRTPDEPDVVLQVDHIVPVSLGGIDAPENLRTLCRDCNGGRSNNFVPDNDGEVKLSEDEKLTLLQENTPNHAGLFFSKSISLPTVMQEESLVVLKRYLARCCEYGEPFSTKLLSEKTNCSSQYLIRLIHALKEEGVIEKLGTKGWRYLG